MLASPSTPSSGRSPLSPRHTPPHLKKYHLWNEEDALVLNIDDGVLTLLREGEIFVQCLLSASELYVCALLLAFYPAYAPMEELQATLTEKPVDDCLKQLNEAIENGYDHYYRLVRPVHNAITRCRKLLVPFGITIQAIDLIGYELRPLAVRGQKPREKCGKRHTNTTTFLHQLMHP
jgi:hypothetical protein